MKEYNMCDLNYKHISVDSIIRKTLITLHNLIKIRSPYLLAIFYRLFTSRRVKV